MIDIILTTGLGETVGLVTHETGGRDVNVPAHEEHSKSALCTTNGLGLGSWRILTLVIGE